MKNTITIIGSIIASIFIIILGCAGVGCTSGNNNSIDESTVSSSTSTTVTTPRTTTTEIISTTENSTITSDKKIETTEVEPSTTKETTATTVGSKTSVSTETTTIVEKSNEDIALEVIKGRWGVGLERKELLEEAGYDYEVIQGIVNTMLGKTTTTTTENITTETTTTTTETKPAESNITTENSTTTESSATTTDSTTTENSTTTTTTSTLAAPVTETSSTSTTTTTKVITTTKATTTTVEATTTTTEAISTSTEIENPSTVTITEDERILLCKLIANEYGGMKNVIERAKIVAAIFNQVERSGNSITTCIYRSCVPWGFNPNKEYYCGGVHYSTMNDAIDYYLANGTAGFDSIGYWVDGADSWRGDGKYNHFYKYGA